MNNLIKNDTYEDMAATFQVFMIHYLNVSLKNAGIKDKNKRKNIINDFGFSFSNWKDQFWFKDTDGNKVFPCISFSKNGPVTDLEISELGEIYLPSNSFSFSEYLNGDLEYYFEEINEDISQIESELFTKNN